MLRASHQTISTYRDEEKRKRQGSGHLDASVVAGRDSHHLEVCLLVSASGRLAVGWGAQPCWEGGRVD